MILLAAAALVAAEPVAGLGDAVQAMQAGRFEQARLMLDTAVKSGAEGDPVERLEAELSFRTGDWATAYSRYEKLAALHPSETLTLERTGIAAFQLGNYPRATSALKAATALPGASWRAWNARGAAADVVKDWAEADMAYARASELAPDHAELLNNRGWSLMLRGEWAGALPLFERAVALNPKSKRMADNLELARAAVAEDLPRRRAKESDTAWAARLNDAGVLAASTGDRQRAIAAFAQAIEARTAWFERAANNLAILQGRE